MQPPAPTTRHSWLRHFRPFHDLETNPQTQYLVHTWAQRFWIANAIPYIWLFFRYPKEFLEIGVLVTGLYSLYANWSTDNGAAAAAKTVMNTTPTTSELERDIGRLASGRYDI